MLQGFGEGFAAQGLLIRLGRRDVAKTASHMHVRSMDLQSIAFTLFGAVLVVRPSIIAKPFIERRERRLAELRQGKEETYFEERRALEAYPPVRRLWVWRLLGCLCLLLGLSEVFFSH